ACRTWMIGTLAALPAIASLLIVPRRFFSLISLGITPWVRLPPTFPCSWTISFWQSITRIAVLPFGSVRVLMFFPPFRTLAPTFSVQGEGSGEELVKRPEAGDEGRQSGGAYCTSETTLLSNRTVDTSWQKGLEGAAPQRACLERRQRVEGRPERRQ